MFIIVDENSFDSWEEIWYAFCSNDSLKIDVFFVMKYNVVVVYVMIINLKIAIQYAIRDVIFVINMENGFDS